MWRRRGAGAKRALLGLLGLALVVGTALVVAGQLVPPDRVYTVAEVQDGVRQHPQAWIGRAVLIRGFLGVFYLPVYNLNLRCGVERTLPSCFTWAQRLGCGPTCTTIAWDELHRYPGDPAPLVLRPPPSQLPFPVENSRYASPVWSLARIPFVGSLLPYSQSRPPPGPPSRYPLEYTYRIRLLPHGYGFCHPYRAAPAFPGARALTVPCAANGVIVAIHLS